MKVTNQSAPKKLVVMVAVLLLAACQPARERPKKESPAGGGSSAPATLADKPEAPTLPSPTPMVPTPSPESTLGEREDVPDASASRSTDQEITAAVKEIASDLGMQPESMTPTDKEMIAAVVASYETVSKSKIDGSGKKALVLLLKNSIKKPEAKEPTQEDQPAEPVAHPATDNKKMEQMQGSIDELRASIAQLMQHMESSRSTDSAVQQDLRRFFETQSHQSTEQQTKLAQAIEALKTTSPGSNVAGNDAELKKMAVSFEALQQSVQQLAMEIVSMKKAPQNSPSTGTEEKKQEPGTADPAQQPRDEQKAAEQQHAEKEKKEETAQPSEPAQPSRQEEQPAEQPEPAQPTEEPVASTPVASSENVMAILASTGAGIDSDTMIIHQLE